MGNTTGKNRMVDQAVDNFFGEYGNENDLATEMGQQLWDEMKRTLISQVRDEVKSLNLPHEIKATADQRVRDACTHLAPKIVAAQVVQIIEGHLSAVRQEYATKQADAERAYREALERLTSSQTVQVTELVAEVERLRQDLRAEAKKRRGVHRLLIKVFEETKKRWVKHEAECHAPAQEPQKKKMFAWGRG